MRGKNNVDTIYRFLSSGWNEPVQYKELNRFDTIEPVSYTHLTLPTTPYV